MTTTAHDHRPALRHDERGGVGTALQAVLADLSDLALAGKQLHWNVIGPAFRSVHLQLDDLVDLARLAADDVAERARALGATPDGRREVVAHTSTLPEVPGGLVHDREAIGHAVGLVVAVSATARRAMEQVGEHDAVTEDLLHQVVQDLEKQAWMFSAHLER